MAYDAGLAEVLREDLQGEPGLDEKKMFGGLAFLRHGHMVCGLYREGGMFRVGKPNMEAALSEAGVTPMTFTALMVSRGEFSSRKSMARSKLKGCS